MCREWRPNTSQKANNKDANQTARMRRLVFAFVVRMQQCQVFEITPIECAGNDRISTPFGQTNISPVLIL